MASDAKTLLEVRGLSKNYPSFRLDRGSFSLTGGTITGFIGRNGAGKSTTINSLLSIMRPDEGKTVFFSMHITSDLEKCADRILFLRGGRLMADDSLDGFRNSWRVAECGKEIPREMEKASRGRCRTRDGYTLLIPSRDAGRFDTRTASLEKIMIHLE